jgi:hypothetical protein
VIHTAHVPIVLARKPGPLQALRIDECRIPAPGGLTTGGRKVGESPLPMNRAAGIQEDSDRAEEHPGGRWPSNVLLSDPALFDEPNAEVVGSGSTTAMAWSAPSSGLGQDADRTRGKGLGLPAGESPHIYGDSGGYSRFFVIPKADRADREPVVRGQIERQSRSTLNAYAKPSEGRTAPKNGSNPRENAHPTVKPVDLMRHLVRLVTPQGGTVLDPFLGSGSTAIAAELEGFPWIGIEKEESYVAIAEARLNGTQRGLGLDVPAPNAPAKRSTGHWPKERTPGSEGWGFTGQTGLEERYDK